MTDILLEDALGRTINEWFNGAAIDVHTTLDAMLAVMAAIAVKAGCNTDERMAVLADHMKTNLGIQLNRERVIRAIGKDRPTSLCPEMVENVTAAARQALDTGVPVRVEGTAEFKKTADGN